MTHFIYILYSESKDKYYVGAAENVDKRLERHNAGASKSTKSGRPWKVVHTEEFDTKTEALKREIQIKKKKSRKYIEWLISPSH
ncbi:MAG: GIY-YIG nuclease family protein [Saprospiraceae bacterium]